MKVSSHQLFTFGMVVFLIAFVALATTLNYQARMMPLIIGVPVLLLAAAQVVIEFRESQRDNANLKDRANLKVQSIAGIEQAAANDHKPVIAPVRNEQPKEQTAPQGRVRQIKAYAWTLAAFLAIYLFGFIITMFVYPMLYMRIIGGRSWRLAGAISLGALAFLYIIMINILNVELYEGVVMIALRKSIYGY